MGFSPLQWIFVKLPNHSNLLPYKTLHNLSTHPNTREILIKNQKNANGVYYGLKRKQNVFPKSQLRQRKNSFIRTCYSHSMLSEEWRKIYILIIFSLILHCRYNGKNEKCRKILTNSKAPEESFSFFLRCLPLS